MQRWLSPFEPEFLALIRLHARRRLVHDVDFVSLPVATNTRL